VAVSVAVAGCGVRPTAAADGDTAPPVSVRSSTNSPYRGSLLATPVTLPGPDRGAPLIAENGTTTTLPALQKQAKLLLLYFGYTHCPDVCPTTMADLATALRQSPAAVRNAVRVVFVTSDPARDTPSAIHAWLSNFDVGLPKPFIGLTGSMTTIEGVSRAVGVPIEPPVKEPDGTITVTHGAQVLAFIGGSAHVVWLAGTSPDDYAHDFPILLKGAS
jgi:protein SCO1/2